MASDVQLARSQKAEVRLAYVDAYAEGFELEIEVIAADAERDFRREGDRFGPDIFGLSWPMAGDSRQVIPPQLLRVGVQLADGRVATNIIGRDRPVDGPVMSPLGGGAGRLRQRYWVSPLPASGSVALVCEWPAADIPLVRYEIDARLLLDGAQRAKAIFPEGHVSRDGREWRLGTDADVAWIKNGWPSGSGISLAIPPHFDAYCTVEVPSDPEADLAEHEQALVELLDAETQPQPWWIGYLDTGASDVIFPYAPRATMYWNYGYVLVQAGPRQAGRWRDTGFTLRLPEVMFPADRTWLVSTMWDDGWTSVGGPEALVDSLLRDRILGPRTQRVTPGEPVR